MKSISLFFFVFSLLTYQILGQANQPEELLKSIPKSDDSTKVELLNQVAIAYFHNAPDLVIKYATQAQRIAKDINFELGLAQASYNLGVGHFFQGNYPKALAALQTAFRYFQKSDNSKGMAQAMNLMGGINLREGRLDQALQDFEETLQIFEKIGLIKQAAKLKVNIGEIHLKKQNFAQALSYEKAALEIAQTHQMSTDIAYANGIIGQVYEMEGQLNDALPYLINALEEFKKLEDIDAIAEYSIYLGRAHFKLGNLSAAEHFSKQGLKYAKQTHSLAWMKKAYEALAQTYQEKGDDSKALDAYMNFMNLKDSIFNQENAEKLLSLRTSFEAEQQQIKLDLQQAQILQLEQKRNFSVLISTVILLAFVGLLLFYRKLQQKKQLLETSNQAIQEQNEEILMQRQAIESKNKEIEKKNKDILSSLRYAKKIQQALMPSEEEILKQFNDSFILFKPKDVVSGDFFWYDEFTTQHGASKKVIAAVDSTGHGVPGALMSMLGLEQLTHIINTCTIEQPACILNKLHEGIVKILKQHQGKNRDGMDLGLCIIDEEKKQVAFSGAKNGLFFIKDGEGHYIKGDRKPIGGEQSKQEHSRTFTNHSIPLEDGMSFYLFSDGFQDQFGGFEDKKFSTKKFRELLLQSHHLSKSKQKEFLEESLQKWMKEGNEKQIDDILVIGFQV